MFKKHKEEKGNVKQVVAIYDNDIEYANRLAQYLGKVKKIPFNIVCFTNEKSLLHFVKEQPISILIVNEHVITEHIQELTIRIQIVLVEEAHSINKEMNTDNRVYKYQSVDRIIQKLLEYVERTGSQREKIEEIWNHKVRVMGVYSLIVRDSAFSITLAQELSKREKVFYCDLGNFSCIDFLFGVESKTDLSDAVYYMHQGNMEEQCVNMIQSYGSMEYISPVRCPEDLRTISSEDVIQLLQKIVECREYETIVLALAECMYMPIELLSLCNIVYVPIKNDLESEAKQRKLLEYLENNGKTSLHNKISFITLPIYREIGEGVPYAEQLLWSEMGDFVRTLL